MVTKRTSACVCFTFSTVSTTLRQMTTASLSFKLNVSFPTSTLERSITSLISLRRSSEFCCIISLHCWRVSLSMESSVRMAEKPERAFRGVRISWLMFDRKRLLVLVEFSAYCWAFSNFSFDRNSRLFPFLIRKMRRRMRPNMESTARIPHKIVLLRSCWFLISSWSIW